ncbi:Protein REVERSION-TO-ETHYLENE SENSITIVITY1 [Acorus calamus]|uniref:Protein REVERSION-TO-ETHYLENE SENSITIVITY1 n=1 Tax=Acorus calamus TaxID=4465 RepID=A0AAV9DC75_ACOCL|nr:Protein REVERSION-TO-ETHYLENE SENSITIVITY1 [Acorus calamus]
MDFEAVAATEDGNHNRQTHHEFWPLHSVDSKKARFPCCLVWCPLPVVSWLAPYIGHLGICQEDGAVLDFSGSNFVNVGNFAYGAVARYLQLNREQCCFPPHMAGHTCKNNYRHAEHGTAMTWDDAMRHSMQKFQHKSYNLFTFNCHSFVANCINRLAFKGSMDWNMINLAALILLKGWWVDRMSIVKSFSPFVTVLCIGVLMVGWPFLIGMASFSFLLITWFVVGTYCTRNLMGC